jgi:aryl-alcohol dehydrogenase-like predicted oxidoreductase
MGDGPNDERLSAYHIKKACEDSLRRLQTDHIDLYQMHHVDRETPWEEIWQAMEQLVKEGKVIYVGSSNFSALHIALAQFEAKKRNFMGIVSEQSLYNLANRAIEMEMIPALREFGIGLIVWGPLNLGMLAGAYEKQKDKVTRRSGAGPKGLYDICFEKVKEQLKRYEEFCKEMGKHPAIVALAWLLKNPIVTAPIIGPRTVKQLKSSIEAFEIDFTEEELKEIDKIWPGPGGEAPEAYAW